MTIRVLIADDHSVVRQGLQMFLALEDDLKVVGEAANGAEALRLAHELLPDVVLMDILMPEMDGIAATKAIRRALPTVEVIALTSVLEDKKIFDAIRVGAIGYLLKDTESEKLCEAIRAAVLGAQPGDVVLVLGKGHEQGQEAQGVVAPFDDRVEVLEAIRQPGVARLERS